MIPDEVVFLRLKSKLPDSESIMYDYISMDR